MRALAVTAVAAAWFGPRAADAQVDYRNVDSGRPLRISDATPTARRSLEVSVGNGRLDKLSLNRYRLQLEPRVSYGLLPRTEISVRSPVFFNERAARPRSGVGGVGIGTEHQLVVESQHVPAIALAAEYFVPTGPAALPSTYAVKALLTRSSRAGRLHLNGSYGTYTVRVPVGFEKIIPPIHGACNVIGAGGDLPLRLLCAPAPLTVAAPGASASTSASTSASASGSVALATPLIATHDRWIAGAAIDHTFPLHAIMLVADVFAQKYRSIGRAADWTAEAGLRAQLTRSIVLDAAVGRLFTGESRASFLTVGTTVSRPLKL